MSSPRRRPAALVAAALVLGPVAVALAGCSGGAAGSPTTSTARHAASTTTTTAPPAFPTGSTGTSPPPSSVAPPAGLVVAPADVGAIVAADTAVNNRANASLSLTLQDSHETCLQGQMDDLLYKAQLTAGDKSSSTAFDQVANRPMVTRQHGYPAAFSVVASDVASGQPDTTAFLTYVRSSSSARWKLASSSFVLGPTAAGVAVPAVATDAQGFATAVPASSGVAAGAASEVASAFTQEAKSGHLPAGVTAQFGPNAGYREQNDPYQVAHFFSSVGTATVTYTTATPRIAAPTLAAAGCAGSFPTYRLADGGFLAVFPIYQRLVLTVKGSGAFTQPGNLQGTPFSLLPGGSYSEVTSLQADVCVAVVPPPGSSAPVEVIGQGLEALSQTGVEGGVITT